MNTKVGITAIIMSVFAVIHLSQAVAQEKTVRACQEEWRANKAANQAAGITEKTHVAQCRSGGAAAKPNPAASPVQTTATPPGAKTAKACREEWRANKAQNQAAGITEKAYVEQCRTGAATAGPTPAAPPPTSAQPSTVPQTTAAQKTVKACREEWRANKADNQAKGITEKAYVEQCRTGAATVAPTPAAPSPTTTAAPPPAAQPPARSAAPPPAQSTTPAQPTPRQTAAPPAAAPAPSATGRPAPQPPSATTGANEFSTEAQAKSHCPTDTVVWVNLRSHIYHFGDTRYYGTTENGTYMCEKEAIAAGSRAAKNETHP
jgi:hypothetical protein